MLARQSKPIDTSSPDAVDEAVVARDAAVGGLELRHQRLRRPRRCDARSNAEQERRRSAGRRTTAVRAIISIRPAVRRRTSPRGDRTRPASTARAVWSTGTWRPTLTRMCCRLLSVTWTCGIRSKLVLAPSSRSRSLISSSIGDHIRPTPFSWRKLVPSAARPNNARGVSSVDVGCSVPTCAWRNMCDGKICPYAANASNTVTPLAQPLRLVTGRHDHLALRADDRVGARKQDALQPKPTSPTPRATVPVSSCRLPKRDRHLDLVALAEACSYTISWLTSGARCAPTAVVITVSSSGNAFSVVSGRGRLSSPRGHDVSRHNVRRCAITASICAAVSWSANEGMIRENPRPRPPSRMVAFQSTSSSGVVVAHVSEVGKGGGFVETDGRVRSALAVGPVTARTPGVIDRVAAREVTRAGLTRVHRHRVPQNEGKCKGRETQAHCMTQTPIGPQFPFQA